MMLKVCMPQSRQRVLRQEPLQKASGIAKEQVENEGPIKGVAFADSQPRLLQSPNDVFSEKSPRPPPTAHGGSLAIQESAIAETRFGRRQGATTKCDPNRQCPNRKPRPESDCHKITPVTSVPPPAKGGAMHHASYMKEAQPSARIQQRFPLIFSNYLPQ